MTVKEIADENSLVEVYLHWLLENNHEVDQVGKLQQNKSLGIYYIWNKDTNKYVILTTDYQDYKDKRIKKNITRYKKSTIFFFPITKGMDKLTEETYEETLRFLGMGDRDSKISFIDSQNMEFIQAILKNEVDINDDLV